MLVRHSVGESFDELLAAALADKPCVACLGPVYRQDPAGVVLEPFRRSAENSRWSIQGDMGLAPKWALERAGELRREAFDRVWDEVLPSEERRYYDWTRAGLVLEIASRKGFRFGSATIRARWDLNATVTGRFGASTEDVPFPPWKVCPLRIAEEHRRLVVPAGSGRIIIVLDFVAMDLRSMLAILKASGTEVLWLENAFDGHSAVAERISCSRDEAKVELFVYAYGGASKHHGRFESEIPELRAIREFNRGSAGEAARRVQSRSAETFRAALSEALPLLTTDAAVPMFAVHDELAIDAAIDSGDLPKRIWQAMEAGALRSSGVRHDVMPHLGRDYAAAKTAQPDRP